VLVTAKLPASASSMDAATAVLNAASAFESKSSEVSPDSVSDDEIVTSSVWLAYDGLALGVEDGADDDGASDGAGDDGAADGADDDGAADGMGLVGSGDGMGVGNRDGKGVVGSGDGLKKVVGTGTGISLGNGEGSVDGYGLGISVGGCDDVGAGEGAP